MCTDTSVRVCVSSPEPAPPPFFCNKLAPPLYSCYLIPMATRANLTVDDVLGELDRDEYESDSEDDFDGYVDTTEREQHAPAVEEPILEHMDVGANVEIASESGSDDSDDSLPEYTCQPGCTIPMGDNRPIDYLSHLVTTDMLQKIVTQTNLYAQQYIESHDLSPHSRVRRWSKSVFDVSQLQRFLAIIIIMGLVRYPQIESHWAVHWPFTNTHCSSVRIYIRLLT